MSAAFVLAAVLASNPSEYPLAAAFAVEGKLLLVELHVHAARVLETGALKPLGADLRRDRKQVVFSAMPTDGGFQQLYLMAVEDGTPERLPTGLVGHLRDGRFTPDGKAVLFAAANTEASGPEHPTKLWRYDLTTKKVLGLSAADETLCQFNPAQLGAEVLHVGTNCYVDYELHALDVAKKKTRTVGRVASAATELATSFDGKTVVYATKSMERTTLWVIRGKEKPAVLATVAGGALLQPRFVCPRDVMFFSEGKFAVVNSKSGEVTDAAAAQQDSGVMP